MDIIREALQATYAKFKNLGPAEQEYLLNAGKENCLVLNNNGVWTDACNTVAFLDVCRYRLRSDYEVKPDIVEIPIIESLGWLKCDYEGLKQLHFMQSLIHFIGFKYEDGNAYTDARRYKNKAGCTLTVWRTDYEVLTPTHVLFRSKP